MIIHMALTKSTKNFHVYHATNTQMPLKTIYIEKPALPEEPPEFVKVTIELLDDD